MIRSVSRHLKKMNNKKIRIAHLISPIRLYGKEKWLIALLKYLDRDKFDSAVIFLTKEQNVEMASSIHAMDIPSYTVMSYSQFSFKAINRIAELLDEMNIDILHSHDSKADVFAFLVKKKKDVVIVSTPHGYSNEKDVKLRFYQFLDKLALSKFDFVVPLSNQLLEQLRNVPASKISLINNFVDTADLQRRGDYNKKLVSFIGRLTPLKRVENAIHAIALTRDVGIELQIIGDGKLKGKLERLANELGVRDRVKFHGFKSDALMLLNQSAVLVVPSQTEGISRVAMEAMTSGIPVIATDIPGNRDLIRSGVNGILVPVNDPDALAGALDRILHEEAHYKELSDNARDYISKNHSAAVVVHEYEALYEKLIRKS